MAVACTKSNQFQHWYLTGKHSGAKQNSLGFKHNKMAFKLISKQGLKKDGQKFYKTDQ